jgi:hypothetical protein
MTLEMMQPSRDEDASSGARVTSAWVISLG